MYTRRFAAPAFMAAAAFTVLAVLATILWFSVSEQTVSGEVPATITTVVTEGESSPWPLIDGQTMPTGAVEGEGLTGSLRNLGVVETPWTEYLTDQITARATAEPLFAASLAQEFGGDAAGQVAFWGLSGLWDENWTDAGDSFLQVLGGEIQDRFLGVADSLPAGKVSVVMANAERDAVRLTFASDELVNVGRLVVFSTECGQVGVDVRGNLYVPCECGRFKIYRPPTPPPPPTTPTTTQPPVTTAPTTVPPATTSTSPGKDSSESPAQDPVVTCPSGQFADRVTGECVPYSATTTTVYDNSGGDSGPGAPGPGVSTPTTDPAPDPTVPTNTGPGDGSIPDPGV